MTNGPREITIGSDIAEIPKVSTWLEEAMQQNGFSDEETLDTQLAVEEAVTNVIVHGYKTTGGIVAISLRFVSGDMHITITDSALPFNPLSLPDPDVEADVNERRIGGLGVYLIRQVMDDIEYQFVDGKNILSLTKKRTPPA